MARTFEERLTQMRQITNDKDLSPSEQRSYFYAWFMMEFSFALRNSAENMVQKYGTRVNDKIDILNFRKELTKL